MCVLLLSECKSNALNPILRQQQTHEKWKEIKYLMFLHKLFSAATQWCGYLDVVLL